MKTALLLLVTIICVLLFSTGTSISESYQEKSISMDLTGDGKEEKLVIKEDYFYLYDSDGKGLYKHIAKTERGRVINGYYFSVGNSNIQYVGSREDFYHQRPDLITLKFSFLETLWWNPDPIECARLYLEDKYGKIDDEDFESRVSLIGLDAIVTIGYNDKEHVVFLEGIELEAPDVEEPTDIEDADFEDLELEDSDLEAPDVEAPDAEAPDSLLAEGWWIVGD